VVGASSLCCIGQFCKELWFNSPHKLLVCANFVGFYVIANKSFKHHKVMCIDCTCPIVSLILTTSKSISGQGRKMNMNSCMWWHKYLKKNSMHILMLKSSREYVILVFWNESQHFMALWYFTMTMCHWQKAWPSQIFVLNLSLHFLITTKNVFALLI
jgi:hypothetical protein